MMTMRFPSRRAGNRMSKLRAALLAYAHQAEPQQRPITLPRAGGLYVYQSGTLYRDGRRQPSGRPF